MASDEKSYDINNDIPRLIYYSYTAERVARTFSLAREARRGLRANILQGIQCIQWLCSFVSLSIRPRDAPFSTFFRRDCRRVGALICLFNPEQIVANQTRSQLYARARLISQRIFSYLTSRLVTLVIIYAMSRIRKSKFQIRLAKNFPSDN